MASVTLAARAGSGSPSSSISVLGTICHETLPCQLERGVTAGHQGVGTVPSALGSNGISSSRWPSSC
jgi:hypothetical protein